MLKKLSLGVFVIVAGVWLGPSALACDTSSGAKVLDLMHDGRVQNAVVTEVSFHANRQQCARSQLEGITFDSSGQPGRKWSSTGLIGCSTDQNDVLTCTSQAAKVVPSQCSNVSARANAIVVTEPNNPIIVEKQCKGAEIAVLTIVPEQNGHSLCLMAMCSSSAR